MTFAGSGWGSPGATRGGGPRFAHAPSGDAVVPPGPANATRAIRVGSYTADLKSVVVDLIEPRERDAAGAVVGDAAATRRSKNTTSQLQLFALRGARMSLMQGGVPTERSAVAPPGSWIGSKRRIFHGKVPVADRAMTIGGCNRATSSLCNVER